MTGLGHGCLVRGVPLGGKREGAGAKPRLGVAKTAQLQIRCTPKQKREIQALAKKAGKSVSEFVLKRLKVE